MVGLRWAGAAEVQSHEVAITAEPGTAGSSICREICTFIGTRAELTVEGLDVSSVRFAEPPLVDGATITLRPGTPPPSGSRLPLLPLRVTEGRRANSPDQDVPHRDLAGRDGPRHDLADRDGSGADGRGRDDQCRADLGLDADRHLSSPRLTVVSGVACGTELVIARGSQWLEPVAGIPTLATRAATSDATEIVMDHADVRIMPGPVPLREGDRLRCGDSWLRLTMPSDATSARHRVSWAAPPTGDDSPSQIITVPRASGQGARMGLLLGLLPLVLGVVITVVTGMWFFMLFSALGAIIAVVSWSVGRAARARERARVAAALERDLRRCGEAAPSAAEVVGRLQTLDSGASIAIPAHRPSTSAVERVERWVSLGEAERTAAVHLGDGPGAVPVEHRRAPVLIDLSRVQHLELAVPSRHREGVINALAVQLLTGPGALHQLIVDPEAGWRAPLLPSLRVVDSQRHRSVTGPALEVCSARTAAALPVAKERVRIVVSVAGDSTEGSGSSAVLSWRSTAVLFCDAAGAVPGLDASAGRGRLTLRVDSVTTREFCRAMQQWSRVQSVIPALRNVSGLPASVGSQVIFPETEQIPDLWTASARVPSLEAPIGVSRHGAEGLSLGDEHPHMLIAGTTGCGKSEVLRTLVAALACRYSPERLEFLFVDFKGGAALSPLTGLPHRSTLLTDLAPEDVRRALEFLRSELRRRERLLAGLGLSDFQSLLTTTPASRELEFRELVVVVDEVKMLADAFSTAGDELAKIATVGRSLGIHLVLATQRPQGAVPADVRANITQAMCLRVRTEQDSADIIGAVVAAGISSTTPGRAFIDSGHGAPVEVQTAILTTCAATPVDEVRIRLAGRQPSDDPLGGTGLADGGPDMTVGTVGTRLDPGVQRVVTEIAETHRGWVAATGEHLTPADAPAPDVSSVRPVPAPLPQAARAHPNELGHVDLGPAENSVEHWTGRASWRPLEDGTLFLIGQPLHTSRTLLSALEQLVRARSGPALYVISATSMIEGPARRWSDTGLIHGAASAQDVSTISGLLNRLSEGAQRFSSLSEEARHGASEAAVLMIEDWDRCCALLRAGSWAFLEDELLALAGAGSHNGVAVVMSGDRSLSVGRASSAGRTRVYFPADQTPEALLQWPKLPAVNPLPLRGVVQGAAAYRCSTSRGQQSRGALTVVQVPIPSGGLVTGQDAATNERVLHGSATHEEELTEHSKLSQVTIPAPDSSVWPRYRPLPDHWSGPGGPVSGLLMGLGTDHAPVTRGWGPGDTLLVVGPTRSGRSSYLDSVEKTLPSRTAVRCHPHTVEELEAMFSEIRAGTTVLIDDADSLATQVIQRLGALWHPGAGTSGVGGRNDLRLIVALRLSDGLPALFPPLMQWRHVADTLLLRPRKAFDGDLFGASLSGLPVGGPPGRGYWIHRGVPVLVQTPYLRTELSGTGDAWTPPSMPRPLG